MEGEEMMYNKKSSFHMGNEFNGYGKVTYVKGNQCNSYPPLSQENVRPTTDFKNCIPMLIGSIPLVIGILPTNPTLSAVLGSMAILNRIIVTRDKATGNQIYDFKVAKMGFTDGASLLTMDLNPRNLVTFTGYMAGWVKQSDGSWKYVSEFGNCLKNQWLVDKGKKYYLNENGIMVTGWLKLGDKWYYFDDSGAMLTNQWVDDGKYWVDGDGIWDEAKKPQVNVDDWMTCVEDIGNWYVKNVHTYLAGGKKNGFDTRKYYYCDIIGKNVGDDCSSYVSACLYDYGVVDKVGYGSTDFDKSNPDNHSDVIGKLESAGFKWYGYDNSINSNFIPQKGDISVQQRGCHHVEIIDHYDPATGSTHDWTWGAVYSSLPTPRVQAKWQQRTVGFWRKEN